MALVLGSLFESNWRHALRTSQGDYSIFFSSTVSLVIVAIIVLSVAGLLVWQVLRHRPLAAEDAGASQ